MSSLAGDIFALAGLLALFAFLVLSTLKINRNRKARSYGRKVVDRLISWK